MSAACLLLVAVTLSDRATAQDPTQDSSSAEQAETATSPLEYVAPKTVEMLVGIRVSKADGNMLGTIATTVFPTDWPEQTVEVIAVNVPPPLQHGFRDLPGGNRQLMFQSRMIQGGAQIEATLQLRIVKKHIVGPDDTTSFVAPRRIARDVKNYLGNSPYIEANSSEIRKIVRDITDQEPLTDWKKVEMFYDWVRENIAYESGDLKSVRDTLKDGIGDCEEMTSTFVALCRAARIPARVVWIPNHCYPEFYLEDKDGEGHWFPCQVAGTRNFGSMPEYLPILQKGDRFKVPEQPELQRYLADFLSTQKVTGRSDPQVAFIRQMLGDAAQLTAPQPAPGINP